MFELCGYIDLVRKERISRVKMPSSRSMEMKMSEGEKGEIKSIEGYG